MKKYRLDPSHYITAPSLAVDAMLKMTEVKLEFLTDNDMYLFFEEGIRGGISMITGRYSEANSPYMGTDYNPDEPTKYIQYLDANSLYGWAMSKQLPVADFEWLSEAEIEQFLKDPNSIVNCTLKVDLDYPDELHDVHSDYPLAPENVEVNDTKKLISHLGAQVGYVAHHNFIRNCLKNGMVLKKIHSGIKYREITLFRSISIAALNPGLVQKVTSRRISLSS